MFNSITDPISLGPAAQSLSLPARRILLAQYADKAQSGHLYSDPQWAAWGATMRRRGMIDHPSLGKAPSGPSPTLDDLMFPAARSRGPHFTAQTNDLVYHGPPTGTPGWKQQNIQLDAYKSPAKTQPAASSASHPSAWGKAWGVTKRVGKGIVSDIPAIAQGLAAVPGVVDRLSGDAAKMIGNATVGAGQELITGNYRGSQQHTKAVEQSEGDAANIIGTMFGAGPKGGLLTDLATTAGYAAGGQKGMAGAKLKTVGQNILDYTQDHPLQQALNVLAVSGVARTAALGEAGRLENLAVKTTDAAAAQRLLNRAGAIRQLVAKAEHIASGGKAGQAARRAVGEAVGRTAKPILNNPAVKGAIQTAKPYVQRTVQTAQRVNRFGKLEPALGRVNGRLATRVPEAYVDRRRVVDMSKAPPKGRPTVKGYPRNKDYFWNQMLKKHPEMFSPENVRNIEAKKAPVVDDQWIKHNPSHGTFKGRPLEHHHHEQGRLASGLPRPVHRAYSKTLHPIRRTRARR